MYRRGVTRSESTGRMISAAVVLTVIILLGTSAYYSVGDGRWSRFDCFYMTVITLSTVGFGETLPGMAQVPEARVLTLALIVAGSGTLLYFVSALTAVIVEGDLQGILRKRQMDRAIQSLQDHIILCGVGTTGRHIAVELAAADKDFVVVDASESQIAEIREDVGGRMLAVVGDATDDAVLERAGIERCDGVIAALSDDRSNVFVTISARALARQHGNERMRIVAKAVEASTEGKLRSAGADEVVSPNYIGGMRLANVMIRPQTVEFLDRILKDREGQRLRIEEIPLGDSSVCGHTLADTRIRSAGGLVIAVHRPDGTYVYNPKGDTVLHEGSGIVVLADDAAIRLLKEGLVENSLA